MECFFAKIQILHKTCLLDFSEDKHYVMKSIQKEVQVTIFQFIIFGYKIEIFKAFSPNGHKKL